MVVKDTKTPVKTPTKTPRKRTTSTSGTPTAGGKKGKFTSPASSGKKGAVAGGKFQKKKFGGKPGASNTNSDGTKKPLPKETAKTRRDRKLARKQKKPKFELTQQCKKIWEKLRCQKNEMSKKQNYQHVEDLLKFIRSKETKLLDLVNAHDTSRIIQCCIKEGNEAQRKEIFDELKDKTVDLSKNKYAKNIVWKMIKYGTSEQRNEIANNFKGKVSLLIRKSKLAASIIEFLYNNYANQQQRHLLLRELYGKIYLAHPESSTKSYGDILKSLEGDERTSLLKSFHLSLLPLVEKSVMTHTLIHKIFFEYFTFCDDTTLRSEMIEAIRETLIHMMHTHDGAHIAIRCLWYGTKKDRKVILKTMKEFVIKLSTEEFGHLALLAAFDCVDDTVFLKKALINPIMKKIEEIMTSNYGKKVLIYLLSPRNTSHFLPETIKLLEIGDGNPTSKKDMKTRHGELVESAAKPIVEYLTNNIETIVFDRNRFLLIEVAMLKLSVRPDIVQPLADAIAQLAVPPFEAGKKDKSGKFHVVEHPSGHLLMKQLIKGESEKFETSDFPVFSASLLHNTSGEKMSTWGACNRGASIVLALLESKCEQLLGEAREKILPFLSTFEQHSTNGVKLSGHVVEKLIKQEDDKSVDKPVKDEEKSCVIKQEKSKTIKQEKSEIIKQEK